MITKELIENRINHFWGYGNLNSGIWFIGMEEGFHGSLADLESRFNRTKNRVVIDVQDDMADVPDHMKWFLPACKKMQKTWSKLILILLVLKSEAFDNEKIKEFQKRNFARINGDHCCLEFMPLPCRSTNKKDWFYDQFGLEYLNNRKEYCAKIMPLRTKLFQELINKYKPKVVICYSLTYLKNWEEIIGSGYEKNKDLYYGKSNSTNFFIIPHSTAHGMTSQQWLDLAMMIKEKAELQ